MKAFLSEGRYYFRTHEVYKGVKFVCCGTSRKGKKQAKENWEKNLEKKRFEINNKEAHTGKVKTLGQELTRWYDLYIENTDIQERTKKTDRDTIKQIRTYAISNMPLIDITSDDLQAFMNEQKQYSVSTMKKRYGLLKRFFEYARPDNNPMRQVVIPAVKKTEELEAYSDTQILKLYKQLMKPYNPSKRGKERGSIYGRALVVCLYQFLRISELLELRVKDVDLENDILYVRRQFDPYTYEIKPPKYNSVRALPICRECYDILKERIIGKDKEDLLWQSGELVPLSNNHYANDRHLTQDILRRILASSQKYAGVPQHTVHGLRHDGISRLVRMGVPAADVSKFAGHKNISTTLERYYRHTEMTDIDPETMRIITGKAKEKTPAVYDNATGE